MRAVVAIAVLLVVATVVGCGSRAEPETEQEQPAAEAAFRRVAVARGFDLPVQLTSTSAEPRRLYVVEQRGTVRAIQDGRVRSGFFLDIRERVRSGGEQGLLGLAFDPRYATNRFVYVNYTDSAGDTRVVRYRTNGRRALAESARLLLFADQPYANHNGGNLVFGPDGRLWVGLGDGGAGGDPENRAQNLDTPFGKMLRLNVRRPGSEPSVFGLGLRNPWRYSFDRATGDLYIADVGQGTAEEVSFTPRGASGLQNYGWNIYEGSRRYSSGEPGPGRLVFPVHEYGREQGNCSITGGFVYRGSARPAERGRYVFGDYCSGLVSSFRVRAGKAVALRREPFRVPSLTSFGENAAGELFAVSHDGVVYRLS